MISTSTGIPSEVTFSLSDDLREDIRNIMDRLHYTDPAEVFAKAIAVMKMANDEGKQLALYDAKTKTVEPIK